jgi:hypothetical protein
MRDYKMHELYRLGELKGILKYLPTRDLQIENKQINYLLKFLQK